MFDSLQPQGLQHSRLHCPSLSPRVCSDLCPSSQWCHQPYHPLCPASPPAINLSQIGVFQWVSSSHQVAKVLEFQLQHQSFQRTPRTDLKPGFSLSFFTFIKRLFSSCLLSAIRVMLSACQRLLIFLLEILIPACASSSPTFCMMYSAYKLNRQGNNIEPWCTLFWILNQFVVPCLFLTIASWPANRFLRRQVRYLVFPSLEEFSAVCCDPYCQRL